MKKGQAAMEFLMTYGWAILVVLAAIGALAYFGVLSPNKLLPERTTFQAPIPNTDIAVVTAGAANSGTVTIALRNNVGNTITIEDITGADGDCGDVGTGAKEISVDGGAFAPISSTSVQNGVPFAIRFTCANAIVDGERFDSDITFTYTNTESTLTRPHKGTVNGKITP